MEKIKVIVADDNEVILEVMKELINGQTDMEVIGEYNNGESAYEAIIKMQPDVIILDILMPIWDGLEVLKQLRNNYNKKITKIVFSSEAKEVQRKLADGVLDDVYYFTKPFKFELFIERIKMAYYESSKKDAEHIIHEFLEGLVLTESGKKYISQSVMLLINDRTLLTKDFCTIIANKEGTTWNNIQRKIRYSIELAYKSSESSKLNTAFGQSTLGTFKMDLNIKTMLLHFSDKVSKMMA